MINFTECIELLNSYSGSEKKKTLIYDNTKYLVKFPDPIIHKNDVSFLNNAFSEYIGSNIFKMVGFTTQNTILGIYNYNGKEKIVCACEDFTDENTILYEFKNLALSTNPDKKIETEIEDIIEVINENKLLNSNNIIQNFWDMFIIDSLIGNTDRHNGNWGIIFNTKTSSVKFSPIYDCGSCLNPMLEDENLSNISDVELKNLSLNCYSCLKENGRKINYFSYIKSLKNADCNKALKRMFPKINITEILSFVSNIECMSNERKAFYSKILETRYYILKDIYNSLK